MIIWMKNTNLKLSPLLDSICTVYWWVLETVLIIFLCNNQKSNMLTKITYLERKGGVIAFLLKYILCKMKKVNNSLQILLCSHKLQHQSRWIFNKQMNQ